MAYRITKRTFDIIFSVIGIIILLPIYIIIPILIKSFSPGPVFYRQIRTGKNWKKFRVYKFRTMVCNADKLGPLITKNNDSRITPIGRFLRKYKIDEIPQFFNVLKGDMSIVGPRPEVPKYAKLCKKEFHEILKVKPGITDIVTLLFNDEEEMLNGSNSEEFYLKVILPVKLRFTHAYYNQTNIFFDLSIIFQTIKLIFGDDSDTRDKLKKRLEPVSAD